jgi:ADP-ribose pyrophosphatase
MAREKVISTKTIFSGRALKFRVDTVQMPDGRETTREIVEHAQVIAVVAIDDSDNVLLVRQYRSPTGKELLEIPAGGIDGNEKPEDAVRREMQEETGYMPQKLVKLGAFYTAPGFCNEYMHLYLATDLVPGRLHAEDTDEISLERVPAKELPTLLTSGKIEDAKSIAGLYMYMEYRERNSKS